MPAERENSWNEKTECNKGFTVERQTLKSITATWRSELSLLIREAKVTVVSRSLIPKGGFQWITEMWNQRINNNFIKFQSLCTYLSLNQLFTHLTIPLLRSVFSSLTNPSPSVLIPNGLDSTLSEFRQINYWGKPQGWSVTNWDRSMLLFTLFLFIYSSLDFSFKIHYGD